MTGGLFAVLDDIAVLLDDVAVMGKVAAKKTAGILGDDLAVNAEKATGFQASRELPVLWAITKGSFLNKLIILPLAFLLSAYLPWLIVPILLIGGAYLGYEGVEKIYHVLFHRKGHKTTAEKTTDKKQLRDIEAAKIKSAIRTDFILSIEIVMIALGTVMMERFILQVAVVSFIAILATVGVYGLVALLVRMDDIGLYLTRKAAAHPGGFSGVVKWFGLSLIRSLPHVIRLLGVVGTIAMLMVGGGMYSHNVKWIHHLVEPYPVFLTSLVLGLIVGSVILLVQMSVQKLFFAR